MHDPISLCMLLHVLRVYARNSHRIGDAVPPSPMESAAMTFGLKLAPQHRVYAGFAIYSFAMG
ncbi:hypothetical protein EN877_33885, partial [Mesorhizobium sp. M1D.F.Ca.ET.234.01.1.1]